MAWELDFWGRFRRAVQAGVADLESSIADYDDNLVFLTSADLFPSFSLFGTIGYASAGSTSPPQSRNSGLSDLFE